VLILPRLRPFRRCLLFPPTRHESICICFCRRTRRRGSTYGIRVCALCPAPRTRSFTKIAGQTSLVAAMRIGKQRRKSRASDCRRCRWQELCNSGMGNYLGAHSQRAGASRGSSRASRPECFRRRSQVRLDATARQPLLTRGRHVKRRTYITMILPRKAPAARNLFPCLGNCKRAQESTPRERPYQER